MLADSACVDEVGTDTPYCDYDALELDAGPGCVSYLWSTLDTFQTIDVLESGQYWVVVEDTGIR